ncbi:MAG: exodeoxyribonuclease VII large subunit [bacterium]
MNKNTDGKNFDKIILTVSEFSILLKTTIENAFYAIRIKGEISGLKTNYPSGYYFDLKDESAKLKCIIFKSDLRKINFDIKDGLSVTVYGRINLYEPRGEYSFIVSEIEPLGYGELYILFERLKEKLKQEGLFDESHKRAVPFLPETIGIVTSRSGAVLHDMVKIIKSRFENVSIVFANAGVQGQNSAAEIAQAIELLNLYGEKIRKIDVIIVGRGGGSIEDLWAFNEEVTARAIYNSNIPVISAVGHETDFTIADFVADRRASTPSNAAEIAVPVKSELVRRVETLRNRIKLGALNLISGRKAGLSNLIKNREKISPKRIIQDRKIRVSDLTESLQNLAGGRINLLRLNVSHLHKRLLLKSPLNVFKERKLYITLLSDRLKRTAEITISNSKNMVKTEIKALNSLSPYNVLKRGYGIVFSEEKKVVSSVLNVKANENIKIVLNDGSIKSKIMEVEPAARAK